MPSLVHPVALVVSLFPLLGFAQQQPSEDLAPIRKQLASKSAAERARALTLLERSNSEAATLLLIGALDDFEPATIGISPNRVAARILGERKEVRAVRPLLSMLGVRTIRVNGKTEVWDGSAVAAKALAQIGDPSAAQPILNTLIARHEQNIRGTRELREVSAYGGAPALPQPIDAHLVALGQLRQVAAVPAIARALNATRPIRQERQSAPPVLLDAPLYPRTREFRRDAFDALAALQGAETTKVLVGLVFSPVSPTDIADAEAVLTQHADPAARDMIEQAARTGAALTKEQTDAVARLRQLLPAPTTQPQGQSQGQPQG